jgi:hypothetical protein
MADKPNLTRHIQIHGHIDIPDDIPYIIIFECIWYDPVDDSGFITPCFVLNSFLCDSVS